MDHNICYHTTALASGQSFSTRKKASFMTTLNQVLSWKEGREEGGMGKREEGVAEGGKQIGGEEKIKNYWLGK